MEALAQKIKAPRGLTSLVSGNLRCELVEVAPDQAAEWLQNRRKNRNIIKAHVDFLANQMERGEFVVSGETVVFNDAGELMDGQHRLSAIVQSGCVLPMLVVWGVPDKFFDTLGQGRVRLASDVLSIGGTKNAMVVAAVARLALRWTANGLVNVGVRPSTAQIRKIVEENPAMERSAAFISCSKEIRTLMPPSASAFAHWKLSSMSGADAADQFLEKIATPSGIENTDPRFVLNRLLTNRKIAQEGFGSHPEEAVALLFKAWNLWLAGRKVTLIGMKPSEAFPIPVNA